MGGEAGGVLEVQVAAQVAAPRLEGKGSCKEGLGGASRLVVVVGLEEMLWRVRCGYAAIALHTWGGGEQL